MVLLCIGLAYMCVKQWNKRREAADVCDLVKDEIIIADICDHPHPIEFIQLTVA